MNCESKEEVQRIKAFQRGGESYYICGNVCGNGIFGMGPAAKRRDVLLVADMASHTSRNKTPRKRNIRDNSKTGIRINRKETRGKKEKRKEKKEKEITEKEPVWKTKGRHGRDGRRMARLKENGMVGAQTRRCGPGNLLGGL